MNVVLDLMIHDIDLDPVVHAQRIAASTRSAAPVFSGEIDIANARIRFANGCVANTTASRVSLKTERKLRLFQDDAYMSMDLQQKILTVIRKTDKSPQADLPPVQIEERISSRVMRSRPKSSRSWIASGTTSRRSCQARMGCARWKQPSASPSRCMRTWRTRSANPG